MGKSQQKCQACGAGRAEEGTSGMIPPMFVTRQPSQDPRSTSLRAGFRLRDLTCKRRTG